jgi:hypothetical protein
MQRARGRRSGSQAADTGIHRKAMLQHQTSVSGRSNTKTVSIAIVVGPSYGSFGLQPCSRESMAAGYQVREGITYL